MGWCTKDIYIKMEREKDFSFLGQNGGVSLRLRLFVLRKEVFTNLGWTIWNTKNTSKKFVEIREQNVELYVI